VRKCEKIAEKKCKRRTMKLKNEGKVREEKRLQSVTNLPWIVINFSERSI
jgi:hypothetical protein